MLDDTGATPTDNKINGGAGSSSVDEQLQLLLQQAGLESVPIDPTSLEALKSYVANGSVDDYTYSSTGMSNEPATAPPPPMPEVEPHRDLKRYTSELTTPSVDSMASVGSGEDSTVAVAGSFVHVEGATPIENQILEQLHRQTRLLLEMQRRIDDLTATVEHLTTTRSGGGGIPSRRVAVPQPAPFMMVNGNNTKTVVPRGATKKATATFATRPVAAPVVPARAAPRPAAQRPGLNGNNNNNNAAAGAGAGGIVNNIRNSRVLKIAYLFWALRRHHQVQDLDGGLIFKILFMMAILTARMSSPSRAGGSSKYGDPDWHTKFAGLTVLVLIGFLMQTGYLKYMYTFFVKENYPDRIWNGENVQDIIRNPNGNNNNNNNNNQQDNNMNGNNNNQPRDGANNNNNNNNNAAAPPPPQGALPAGRLPPNHPPRPGAAAGAIANANAGWRNTFLGGMIPQADRGGVAGALQDVALLFGSFLMSIFPMWQPEGPPQRRRQPPAPPQQQQPEDQPNPGGLAAGPGAVRPPRDPVQAVDDSDDEGGDGIL